MEEKEILQSDKNTEVETLSESIDSTDTKAAEVMSEAEADVASSDETAAREKHAKRREYLYAIAMMALSIAMTTIGAYISIPIGTIKITLQFLVTNTVCLLLGKKWGGLSIWIYILMGLVGLPIFSQFAGGLSYVLQPSFGFLIGFAVGGQVAAFVREKSGKDTYLTYFISSLIGLVVLDVIGVVYGAIIMYGYMHSAMSVWKFLVAFLLPFIPIDIAKCALSALLCNRLYKFVKLPRK